MKKTKPFTLKSGFIWFIVGLLLSIIGFIGSSYFHSNLCSLPREDCPGFWESSIATQIDFISIFVLVIGLILLFSGILFIIVGFIRISVKRSKKEIEKNGESRHPTINDQNS